MTGICRRRFGLASAASVAGGWLGGCAVPSVPARSGEYRGGIDPFTLGVASGYPRDDGAVIWTRLAPSPTAVDGGLDPVAIAVRWELAEDDAFGRIVASGVEHASPRWAHSVRVELHGLAPQRWYHYRFASGDARSAVGRFRTAPAAGGGDRLRFAFGSCQQYEHGWYAAYRHIVADAPELMVFLGDYIYEDTWGRNHVRRHDAGLTVTLADYRRRHALYRRDPDLQSAHAATAWILTWDDHEVDNDYANDRSQRDDRARAFLARRAAAYQAYFEHLPLPWSMAPDGPNMRIHTAVDFGALVRFHLLDDRQYRSHQACPRPGRGGANVVGPECRDRLDSQRTMLGAAQEQWLASSLRSSPARWNVLAQQTLIAQAVRVRDGVPHHWTDGWDGYPAARQRLLRELRAQRVANPVAIGGDVHCFYASELHEDFDRPGERPAMVEFVATSISSNGWSQQAVDALMRHNPHLRYGDSRHRGYVRVDLARDAMRIDLRALHDERDPATGCFTARSFELGSGSTRLE